MSGFATIFALAVAASPPTALSHSAASQPAESREPQIEGIRVNGTIYFDAPIHSVQNRLR